MDLGFVGSKFTWLCKRANSSIILERLDTSLCNLSWHDLFPNATVFHLPRVRSNHAPFLTDLFHSIPVPSCKPFYFESSWFTHLVFSMLLKLLGMCFLLTWKLPYPLLSNLLFLGIVLFLVMFPSYRTPFLLNLEYSFQSQLDLVFIQEKEIWALKIHNVRLLMDYINGKFLEATTNTKGKRIRFCP